MIIFEQFPDAQDGGSSLINRPCTSTVIVCFLMLLAYTLSLCISDMCLHSEFESDICDVLGIVSEILRESQRAVHFTRQP